ncbi:MAG TPA: PIN domain-containing protein [Ilumatobacteraceae bacterium]|nr:PIN domain-containing protein [Ilumatobacteraceae bacterium]
MTILLDANVLIALTVADHVHHLQAEQWLAGRRSQGFATTPSTQGTLLRHLIRNAVPASSALQLLTLTTADPRHTFWPDDQPYDAAMLRGVIGHRQVTDAYLAGLARHRQSRIATFDAGFAAGYGDIVELIAVEIAD